MGREEEIGLLKKFLHNILNYEGKCVAIEGEVGIGKTRLLKEFRNVVEPLPFQILSGKGVEGSGFMEPFGSMLTDYFSNIDNRSQKIARYILSEDLSNLSNLNPQLLEYYPFEISESKEVSAQIIFSSLFNFFSNFSRFHPLALIIDDAHWLDEEALEFLEYLCYRIEDMPILVILSTRNLREEELLPRVSARRILQRVQLKPLSQEAVRDALSKLFEQEIPERFLRWLHKVTKGNPFFVEEIIKALIKKNLISYREGRWEIREYYEEFPLPDNIVSFTRDKIKEIDRDGLRFLRAASVLGEEFSIKEIGELLKDFSRERFLNSLHLLELEGILEGERGGIYKFHHPLMREVLVQDMDKKEKRVLHRKVAKTIEKIYPGKIEEIAFHRTQELSPEEWTEELVSLLKKTSSLFQSCQNWKKAKEYLRLAKDICSHISEIYEKERLEIDARLLSLMGQSGEELPPIDRARELIKRLLSTGLKKEALNIFNVYVRHLMDRFQFREAKEMLDKALEILNGGELLEQWRLRYLRCILAVKQGKYKEAEEKGLKLIKDIDPKISPIGRWFPTNLLGGVTFSYGDLETSQNYYQAALKIAQDLGNRDILATAYGNLSLVFKEMGEINKAIEYSKKHLEIITELGNEYKLAKAHDFLASCALLKRDFSFAESHAQQFRILAQRNDIKEYILEAGLKWFYIYFEQKKIEEAKRELENLYSFKIESLSGLHQVELLTARAMIVMEDSVNDALRFLNSALSISKEKKLNLAEGRVLTQRGICFLKKRQKTDAWKDFEKAKEIFTEKKALLSLARLLISFGKEWKGREKDSILIQGLEYLKKMGLSEELKELAGEINKKRFPKSYRFVEESLRERIKGEVEKKILNIFTFGGLSVEDPKLKEPIPEKLWGSKKAKELLGLLLVLSKRKGVTREILSSYLWPEMGSKEAQNNFHVTLSHLRKVLGSEGIIYEEPFYKLNTRKFWVDYLEFERLYRDFSRFKTQGKLHLAEEKARRAVKLYQGDFLPEMYSLPIDDEQMVLKERTKELLLWIAITSKERLEWKEVLVNGRRLLQIDPTDERAHRLVMEALCEQGDRGGVIKHYDRLKKILKTELGVEPEPQTKKLYQDIKETGIQD